MLQGKKMRWHFSEQRWVVKRMFDVKVKDRVPSKMFEKETRNRIRNIGTTAKQVAMVWASVAKRRQLKWRFQDQEQRRLAEIVQKTVKHVNWTGRMDRSRWRKVIKDGWWSGHLCVGECFFRYQVIRVVPDKGHKTVVVVPTYLYTTPCSAMLLNGHLFTFAT